MELGKRPDNIIPRDPRDKLYTFEDFYVFARDKELAIDSMRTYISSLEGYIKFMKLDTKGSSESYEARMNVVIKNVEDYLETVKGNISQFTTKDDKEVD